MKPRWTKKLPTEPGWYWARWRDKDGVWQKTPASLLCLSDGTRCFDITGAENLFVFPKQSEAKARRFFHFNELKMWTEKIRVP